MGYKINYDEMYTIVGHINKKLVHISNVLNCLYNAFTELSETENIKGKTADSIKGYIKDVHMNLIIPAIYEVINCIYLKSTMYFFGMHNVDSDPHAYIDEENLIALKTVLKELGIRLCDIIDSGQDIKRNISGTVEMEFPDSDRMAEDMQSLTDIITRLDEDMQLHETEGLAAADELYNTLSKLWTLIRERRDKDIDIGSYKGEDFSKYDYVKGIVEALNKESIYIQEHEAELISAEERQAEAIEALESEQRERGGKNKVLTSVLNMIQGGVTMYLALTTKNVSMLIKGGMIFFSLTSIGYNTNELEIGLDDMYYGSIGDIYTESEGWLNISEDAEPYYHFAGKLATIMTDVGGAALGIKALKGLKSDDVADVVSGAYGDDVASIIKNVQYKTPQQLVSSGWKDVTNPKMAVNTTSREFYDPKSGLKIRFDKGVDCSNGFEALDHYHIINPNYTNKKIDYYLDINGNPVGKGSKASHIVIKGEE